MNVPPPVERWLAWAKEHKASCEILVRYEVKTGRLVRVVVRPPDEVVSGDIVDQGGELVRGEGGR